MDKGIESPRSPDGSPSRFLRSLDYIFVLRPIVIIPVWTFFLLGAWHSGSGLYDRIDPASFFYGIAAFTLLIGAVYIVNQISDRVSDLENDKLYFLPRAIIRVRSASIEAALLIISSFAISIAFLPGKFTIILLLSLLLGMAYSVEPVRLKKRAAFDVLANAVGIGVLNPLAGWVIASGDISGSIVLLPYPFAVASIHILTALADIEGDRKNSLNTTGVALGKARGAFLSILLMAVAAASGAVTGNRQAVLACLLSLPAFIVPLQPGKNRFSDRGILIPAKVSTLIFAIVAGYLFRMYLPFLFIVIVGTKVYYQRRFQVSYPSF